MDLLLRRLWQRSFHKLTLERMRFSNKIASRRLLPEVLGLTHLTILTIGHMVGAGIFVLLGRAASEHGINAGPAVELSILLAGGVASLSALCVCEMASDYPLAGGAFNYVMAVFGEFPAWMTIAVTAVGTMALGGALARVWSGQLAVLCHTHTWQRQVGSVTLDFVAMGITFVALFVVALGTKLTSWLNIALKIALLSIVVAMLVKAFPEAHSHNWDEFFPGESHAVFAAASLFYFAYSGHDAASNLAEEAKSPERTVWKSILLALAIVVTLYLLMASALTLAIPASMISPTAPFYSLFKDLHESGMADAVTVGALLAVGSVLMVNLLCNCRQFLAMARYHLIPSWLARVDDRTLTPLRLTIAFGLIEAFLALTTPFAALVELRSAGALFVVIMVACATLWRRYYRDPQQEVKPENHDVERRLLMSNAHWTDLAVRLAALVAAAQGFGAAYIYGAGPSTLIVLALVFVLTMLSFRLHRQVYIPRHFRIPLATEVCSCVIFGASFLLWLLGRHVMWRFATVLGGCALLYVLYGVHAAAHHDRSLELYDQLLDAGVSDAELQRRMESLDAAEREWVRQERARKFIDELA